MTEVDVGLVEQDVGAGVVVMLGRLDNSDRRQKGLEVQGEMELGGGLAAAMLGPYQPQIMKRI